MIIIFTLQKEKRKKGSFVFKFHEVGRENIVRYNYIILSYTKRETKNVLFTSKTQNYSFTRFQNSNVIFSVVYLSRFIIIIVLCFFHVEEHVAIYL